MPRYAKKPQLKRLRDDSMLDISDSIIAGRHSTCGINLSHEEGASRKHARFNLADDQLTITDLGSLNGTLVNGIEIEGTHVLENSDIIIFDTDKYLLSIPMIKRAAPKVTTSTADTVIANKAERINPDSIAPAIKIITDQAVNNEAHNQPSAQYENTVEYLNSLPTPDMKRPVGMLENCLATSGTSRWAKKWLLPLFALAVIVFAAYQLGTRAT